MSEPLKLFPGGIEAVKQSVISSGRRGGREVKIQGFFDKAELMDAVGNNGEIELQVVGKLISGQVFFGNSNIFIK